LRSVEVRSVEFEYEAGEKKKKRGRGEDDAEGRAWEGRLAGVDIPQRKEGKGTWMLDGRRKNVKRTWVRAFPSELLFSRF
jgi:hypothetical protein